MLSHATVLFRIHHVWLAGVAGNGVQHQINETVASKRNFQLSSDNSMAVPWRTNCRTGMFVVNSTATTKLVETPVVDNSPLRADVLYVGQT